MIKNEKLLEMFTNRKFDDLEKALRKNTLEEIEKAAGKKTGETAIIKRMLSKTAKFNFNHALKKQHNFIFEGVEYFAILDGYYMLAQNAPFPGVEIAEDHEKFDCAKIFGIIGSNEITLDLFEIKKFHKETKKTNRPYTADYKGKAVCFNPEMISDCMEFCETNKAFIDDIKSVCLRSPMIFKGENKIALALPVNCTDPAAMFEFMENWRSGKIEM